MIKKMSYLIRVVLVFFVIFNITMGMSFADSQSAIQPGQIETAFFSCISFIFKHVDDLGISDKQFKRLKELHLDTQKEVILKNAKIKTIIMDLDNEISQDFVYLKPLSDFVDLKHESLKSKEKFFAESFLIIREILDDNQYKKLKEIYIKEE